MDQEIFINPNEITRKFEIVSIVSGGTECRIGPLRDKIFESNTPQQAAKLVHNILPMLWDGYEDFNCSRYYFDDLEKVIVWEDCPKLDVGLGNEYLKKWHEYNSDSDNLVISIREITKGIYDKNGVSFAGRIYNYKAEFLLAKEPNWVEKMENNKIEHNYQMISLDL